MLQALIDAVRKAGQVMLSAPEHYRVKRKANEKDYVTEFDVKTQQVLVEELKKIAPDAHFLCEESPETHGSDISMGNWFIIDPIDGTTNFIKGLHHSAVSLGMTRGGVLTYGVVYNPFYDEMFSAEKGKGAFLNGVPIEADTCGMDGGVGLFGASPTAPELRRETFRMGEMIYEKMWDIRRFASAALDLCYIACGRGVVFAEYVLYPWDFAGGKLIAEEAGATVTRMDGSKLTMENHVSVLAGTKTAHAEFLAELQKRGLDRA